MLATPVFAGSSDSGLDLIKDEQDLVIIANPAERPQPFAPEMIIASLALNWLDNNGSDVLGFAPKDFPNLRLRPPLLLAGVFTARRFGEGKIQARGGNPRPGKFGEIIRLARIGVSKTQGVAAAPVKGPFKVEDFRAAFPKAGSQILAHFPIHGRLERVFHGHRASLDKEVALQWGEAHHPVEGLHELGVRMGINIRIGHFGRGGREQILLHSWTLKIGMVIADGERTVKTIKIEQLTPADLIHQVAPLALFQIDDDAKAIDQDVFLQGGNYFFRRKFLVCAHFTYLQHDCVVSKCQTMPCLRNRPNPRIDTTDINPKE